MKTLLRTGGAIQLDGHRLPGAALGIDEEGRIEFVTQEEGPLEERSSEERSFGSHEGYAVYDRRAWTLVPLIADAHVHLGISDGVRESPAFHTPEHVDEELGTYLRCGVGHVLSLGTDQPWMQEEAARRQRVRARSSAIPYSAGRGFGAKEGWPPELTSPEPRFRPERPEKARQQVRLLARRGIRVVKLWVDDLSGDVPKLPVPVIRAITEEARREGLTTCAHVFSLEDARNLVECRVDALAHSIRDRPVDGAFAEKMAGQGTKLIPTLAREEAAVQFASEDNAYLTDAFYRWCVGRDLYGTLAEQQSTSDPEEVGDFRRALDTAMRNLDILSTAGVTVLLGTDAGFRLKVPGFSQHRELQLMRDAGVPGEEVLAAALGNNRSFFARAASEVSEGEPASFFLVKGNPLEDIRHTTNIGEVWQSGEIVASGPALGA